MNRKKRKLLYIRQKNDLRKSKTEIQTGVFLRPPNILSYIKYFCEEQQRIYKMNFEENIKIIKEEGKTLYYVVIRLKPVKI